MDKTLNRVKCLQAQLRYCEQHEIPTFMIPMSGFCPHCNRDVYSDMTPEEASQRLLTGCPWCHRSFVD